MLRPEPGQPAPAQPVQFQDHVRKLVTNVQTFVGRLSQQARETFQNTDRTEIDQEVERLWAQFLILFQNFQKLRDSMESFLQPNPGLRIERAVFSRFDSDDHILQARSGKFRGSFFGENFDFDQNFDFFKSWLTKTRIFDQHFDF